MTTDSTVTTTDTPVVDERAQKAQALAEAWQRYQQRTAQFEQLQADINQALADCVEAAGSATFMLDDPNTDKPYVQIRQRKGKYYPCFLAEHPSTWLARSAQKSAESTLSVRAAALGISDDPELVKDLAEVLGDSEDAGEESFIDLQ